MSKIKVGDTVRVVGKAVCGTGQMEELIEIGTVCEVVSVIEEDVELIPKAKMCVWNAGFFYPISSVEKGREIWLSDNRRRKIPRTESAPPECNHGHNPYDFHCSYFIGSRKVRCRVCRTGCRRQTGKRNRRNIKVIKIIRKNVIKCQRKSPLSANDANGSRIRSCPCTAATQSRPPKSWVIRQIPLPKLRRQRRKTRYRGL